MVVFVCRRRHVSGGCVHVRTFYDRIIRILIVFNFNFAMRERARGLAGKTDESESHAQHNTKIEMHILNRAEWPTVNCFNRILHYFSVNFYQVASRFTNHECDKRKIVRCGNDMQRHRTVLCLAARTHHQ